MGSGWWSPGLATWEGVCPHQFIEDLKIVFWLFVILFGVGYGKSMDLDRP